MQLDEPVECALGGDPLLLYEVLHLLFFPLVRILCALRLESRKKLSTWSWCGAVRISVSSAEGMSHQPIQNSATLFRGHRQTPGLISRNNFVKKFLSVSFIAIMSWQDVTWSSLCSGVKECGTKRAHNFLFPKSFFQNPKNYSLGDVQRFYYHSWCDSTVMLDQISNSSNRVDFGRPPFPSSSTSSLPSRYREYHLQTFDRFRASVP